MKRKTHPWLTQHLVRVLDEAESFGVEHRLDAGEGTNRDRYRLLVTDRVWDLPGDVRVGPYILSKGTLVLVNTYSIRTTLSWTRRSRSLSAHLRGRYQRLDHQL